jgi:hypothetical protein
VSVSCRMARVSMHSSPLTEGNAACPFDGGSDGMGAVNPATPRRSGVQSFTKGSLRTIM